MDSLWAGMLICGIVYAACSGNLDAVTEAILASAKEAVQLSIALAGVMAFWTGLMEIAQDCGLVDGLTRSIRPVIRFLFPNIPDGHRAQEYIGINMVANMLGLGGCSDAGRSGGDESAGTDRGRTTKRKKTGNSEAEGNRQ